MRDDRDACAPRLPARRRRPDDNAQQLATVAGTATGDKATGDKGSGVRVRPITATVAPARRQPFGGGDDPAVTALSDAVARHRLHLDVDAIGATLWEGRYSVWAARWLPDWSLALVTPALLAGLRDCAGELAWALAQNQVSVPGSTADELVRLAVLVSAVRSLDSRLAPADPANLRRCLRMDRELATCLWQASAARNQADPALLHARGHQRLLVTHWLEPATAAEQMAAVDGVAFTRRCPLPANNHPCGLSGALNNSEPARLDASVAADERVACSRRKARRWGHAWVPSGSSARDQETLEHLARTFAGRPVDLTWQPLRNASVRSSDVVLADCEVDLEGSLYAQVIWQQTLLAVPATAVISITPIR